MADATTFYRSMISQVGQFITMLEQLQLLSDRIASDPTLVAAATAAARAGGRTDLTEADFNNCKSAIDQLWFTYNSGDPTQKSYLYKML